MSIDSVRKSLDDALRAYQADDFDHARFFNAWFRDMGGAYFFLFRRNQKVTDIQVAELQALLRMHATELDDGAVVSSLNTITDAAFRDLVSGLLRSLLPDSGRLGPIDKETRETFCRLYADLLSRTIVVHPLATSCGVYVPPGMTLRLDRICGESGYVHSCGRSVFMRTIDKADKQELFDALDNHLARYLPDGGNRLPFIVYADEDFTSYDRNQADDLEHGLDGVKIRIEKFGLGESLVNILRDMRETFNAQLLIPDPGNYKVQHQDLKAESGLEPLRSLFLITDDSTEVAAGREGRRYVICYDQVFVNKNPFFLFDENKPAWISHTTLPHTLAAAMLNLCRASSTGDRLRVVDPFVGSGTTTLEALKFSDISAVGSDLDPMSRVLVQDNLDIFGLSIEDLAGVIKELDAVRRLTSGGQQKLFDDDCERSPERQRYEQAREFITQWKSDLDAEKHTIEMVVSLEERDLIDRILVYVALRTLRRNLAEWSRSGGGNDEVWMEAFAQQLKRVLEQLKLFVEHRRQATQSERVAKTNLVTFPATYSTGTTISIYALKRARRHLLGDGGDFEHRLEDVHQLKPESCDIVIADPPYGVNAQSHKMMSLAELWEDAVERMVHAVRDGGHLILCLPDRSNVGRRTPYFAKREIVAQQIVTISERMGRVAYRPSFALGGAKPYFPDFGPPYRWESGALYRTIVHFRLLSGQTTPII